MKIMVFILYCGWALMVPQLWQEKQSPTTWSHYQSYDTAQDCQEQISFSLKVDKGTDAGFTRALAKAKCLPIDVVYGRKEHS